jgi:hypothetical protein
MVYRFKKIWKDPVWSKVIAAGIIAFVVWISGFYTTLYILFQIVLLHIWSNIFLYLFIISLVVIISLLRKLNKTKDAYLSQKKTSSNWFITLNDDAFYKYLFLLWFPLHRTLQTEKFFYNEKFDHIPEFYELYTRKVIFNKNIGAVEYVIVINKEVYDYLDDFYQREKDKFDIDMNQFVDMLKNVSFYELCRGRSL